jgi:PKD repeat protein
MPSCLFKGSNGQVATQVTSPLNDEQWHDLTCVYTPTGVTAYVDGAYNSRKNGSAGTIDNTFPMTVGGKISCNQDTVTCDYFSGQIDFLKISKGANVLPTASYTSSCFGLSCSFDSSASVDPDGSITQYAWDFGDGQTSTLANPSHTYASPGTYPVRLTVTDNQAATDRENQTVTVEDTGPIQSPIQFVASAVSGASNNHPTVTVPASATPGDRLLMVLSYNNLSATVSQPTGVTGWTQLDSIPAGSMDTVAWTKVVAPGDPGTSVSVPLSAAAKYTLTAADYTGTATTPSIAFADTTLVAPATTRMTPTVDASLGDWVVSYWADKSSTTTAWTASSSVTSRSGACGDSGAGRICSLLADSGAALPPAPYGDIAASTNASSSAATMWSFVLEPSTTGPPPNQPPTAAFSSQCTLLDCTFDSSGSGDSDGTITSYAWDFGDGDTSTDAAPAHSFGADGSYDVKLTVTDDDGDTDSVTHTVTVHGPVSSDVGFVGSAASQANNASPAVTVPGAAAVGDTLVLAFSLNDTTRTVSAPTGVTGWTQLDNLVATDMRSIVWTKVVQAGDPGTQVRVPLSGVAKYTLTVADYSGVDTPQPVAFADAVDLVKHTDRTTPTVKVPDGAWVVSYWADKSSTTTAWTAPGSVTSREALCNAASGQICSLLADSGAAQPAGSYSGVTASTNAASNKATTWSIVLRPAG